MNTLRVPSQEISEVSRYTLYHWVNGIHRPVIRFDCVPRKKVIDQQPAMTIEKCPICELREPLGCHQSVDVFSACRIASDTRLRGDDRQLTARPPHYGFQPDIVIEDTILEREPIQVFSGSSAM